jgi:hypothetical protein
MSEIQLLRIVKAADGLIVEVTYMPLILLHLSYISKMSVNNNEILQNSY